MTRVDFYLLDNFVGSEIGRATRAQRAGAMDGARHHAADGSQDAAVCKLAHKAFRFGHRIYVLTPDFSHAQRLDRLLWIFSAGSFIPHGLSQNNADADMPVLIGYDEPPASHEDVLIQLTPQVPEWFSRFQRVAEVVSGADEDKALARERFRFYRDRGYALQTHNISAGDFVEA